jgi:hypothetical protein
MDLWVKKLLRKKLDLEKFQIPGTTIDQAIQILEQSEYNRKLIIVGSEKNKVLVLLYPTSKWTFEIDLISDCKGMLNLYKVLVKMRDWFWKNYPEVHKLEMTTTKQGIVKLAERAGWKQEGLKKESYMDYNTMKYKNEYIYGLINPNH